MVNQATASQPFHQLANIIEDLTGLKEELQDFSCIVVFAGWRNRTDWIKDEAAGDLKMVNV